MLEDLTENQESWIERANRDLNILYPEVSPDDQKTYEDIIQKLEEKRKSFARARNEERGKKPAQFLEHLAQNAIVLYSDSISHIACLKLYVTHFLLRNHNIGLCTYLALYWTAEERSGTFSRRNQECWAKCTQVQVKRPNQQRLLKNMSATLDQGIRTEWQSSVITLIDKIETLMNRFEQVQIRLRRHSRDIQRENTGEHYSRDMPHYMSSVLGLACHGRQSREALKQMKKVDPLETLGIPEERLAWKKKWIHECSLLPEPFRRIRETDLQSVDKQESQQKLEHVYYKVLEDMQGESAL